MTLPADPTIPEIRDALAPLVADNAAFDGWKAAARDLAADTLGVDRDIALLALPDAAAMIDAWFASIDRGMAEALPPERLGTMKVRDKITALVEARLDLLAPHRETLRRALAILAMPQNVAHSAKLGWRAADAMWRAAGDTATDYNHYTKRAMLGAVYAATITVFLDDESEGQADTRAFLSRRIAEIMAFEKAKGQFLARTSHRPSLSRFIGRLRYPAV
ncbi:MAG: COQ9 family protein [Sphingomonas sp.]|uniref:COQ9 family protein n=1 Tax=Sphingomonas sp. TaxID=28214 RepID=UPI00122ACE34|nr:COQ9 family protein [Sphingomonas sp.]THD36380.1 MAG: COQ9 family protein [Sphingomonas sp.]